jgi:hypothetical protein
MSALAVGLYLPHPVLRPHLMLALTPSNTRLMLALPPVDTSIIVARWLRRQARDACLRACTPLSMILASRVRYLKHGSTRWSVGIESAGTASKGSGRSCKSLAKPLRKGAERRLNGRDRAFPSPAATRETMQESRNGAPLQHRTPSPGSQPAWLAHQCCPAGIRWVYFRMDLHHREP